MKKIHFFLMLSAILSCGFAKAQHIVYADVNKSDVARMNFEIIGKEANHYLIYKEVKGRHRFSVYDENMRILEEVPVSFLPNNDELLDLSFFTGTRGPVMLYQYQDGDIVYLKAAKIEANGHVLEEPVVLDTTRIAYKSENKIYNILGTNDLSKLMVFKINKKDRNLYRFTTKLFDAGLQPINESRFTLPMEDKGMHLSGYSLANDGSYAFIKYSRQSNGNITDAIFIEKPANTNQYNVHELDLEALFLDDLKVLVDDANHRYLLSSFFSTTKNGDIDGLYISAFDKNLRTRIFEKNTLFTEDLRKKAKGRSNPKNAFDNFFINNMIAQNDGSFTISTEALYNTGNPNRWGYWGSPYWGPGFAGYWSGWGGPAWGWGWGRWGGYWWPYSYYTPYFYRSYWWGGWGPGWYGPDYRRFNAGNIAIVAFDKQGNKTWDRVIVKSQSETDTDGSISYQVLLTDDHNMHFLMNNAGKISDLETVSITSSGNAQSNPPLAAKDKNIDFMPRYGKQTGSSEMIIPYSHKGNISFAKVAL